MIQTGKDISGAQVSPLWSKRPSVTPKLTRKHTSCKWVITPYLQQNSKSHLLLSRVQCFWFTHLHKLHFRAEVYTFVVSGPTQSKLHNSRSCYWNVTQWLEVLLPFTQSLSHRQWQAPGVEDQDILITKKAFHLNYSTVWVPLSTITSRKTTAYLRRLDQLAGSELFPNSPPPPVNSYTDQNQILYTSMLLWRHFWTFRQH